jgi:hypothetical protein
MLKYTKSKDDKQHEERDLKGSPVMRYLRNQEALKFNVGDIVVKQTGYQKDAAGNQIWKTDTTPIGAPKKFMYVFENELGVGYIKQLKADGTGFTSFLQCVANFDCEYTRLALDPDFVDHMLIGDSGDQFQYNALHAAKKLRRKEAMDKNRKIILNMKAKEEWFNNDAKAGDRFWYAHSHKELHKNEYEIIAVERSVVVGHDRLKVKPVGKNQSWTDSWDFDRVRYAKITLTKPYSLEDEL